MGTRHCPHLAARSRGARKQPGSLAHCATLFAYILAGTALLGFNANAQSPGQGAERPAAAVPVPSPVQRQAPSSSPPQLPPQSPDIPISIAESVNISIAAETSKRLLGELKNLPSYVGDVLLGVENLTAKTRKARAGFAPPSDDDLSFASFGDADEVIKQIADGFPDVSEPLLLLTIAERGQSLIFAAYLVQDSASGQKELQRVYRQMRAPAQVTTETVQAVSGCIASAVRRHLRNDGSAKAECVEQKAQTPADKGAAPPAGAPKAPAQPQTKTASAVRPSSGSGGGGMLDDVPEKPGQITILPASGQATSKPAPGAASATAGNTQTAKATPAPQPPAAVATQPRPGSPAGGPTAGNAQVASNQAGSSVATPPPNTGIEQIAGNHGAKSAIKPKLVSPRLVEAVFGYSLPWVATAEKNDYFYDYFSEAMTRRDSVGQCLQDFKNVRRGSSRSDGIAEIVDELQKGHNNSIGHRPINPASLDFYSNHYIIDVEIPSVSHRDFATRCFAPARPMRLEFLIASQQVIITKGGKKKNEKMTIKIGDFTLKEAIARLARDVKEFGSPLRMPHGVEAFAIAQTLLQINPDRRAKFWMRLEGNQPAVFTIIRSTTNIITVADYEPTSPDGKETAMLVVVNGLPAL